MPRGVAAPPIPRRLAEKLRVMYSKARSLSPLNSLFVIGRKRLLSILLRPIPSIRVSTDSHIAYIATSVKASLSAELAPLIIMENALSGETTMSITSDAKIIIVKTIFIKEKLPYSIV